MYAVFTMQVAVPVDQSTWPGPFSSSTSPSTSARRLQQANLNSFQWAEPIISGCRSNGDGTAELALLARPAPPTSGTPALVFTVPPEALANGTVTSPGGAVTFRRAVTATIPSPASLTCTTELVGPPHVALARTVSLLVRMNMRPLNATQLTGLPAIVASISNGEEEKDARMELAVSVGSTPSLDLGNYIQQCCRYSCSK